MTDSISIGFNSGDKVGGYNVPGALTDALQDIEDGSNIGVTGVYVFRVDQPFVAPGNGELK